jgi:hypothetical protein
MHFLNSDNSSDNLHSAAFVREGCQSAHLLYLYPTLLIHIFPPLIISFERKLTRLIFIRSTQWTLKNKVKVLDSF